MKQEDVYRSPNQQNMLDQLNFALEALEQFEKVVDKSAVDPLIKRVNDGVYDAQESVSTAIVALQTARDIIEETVIMRTITLSEIKKAGCRKESVEFFEETFGEESPVTVDLCIKYAEKFDWTWASRHLLTGLSLKTYKRLESEAGRVHDSIVKPALKEYYRCLEGYNQGEIAENQWKASWKAYYKVADALRNYYEEMLAAAFAEAWNEGGDS